MPRLHRVLNPVDSDGSGLALIDIWPRLRESPIDGAQLILSACKGVFRLADNNPGWSISFAKMYGIEITCVEA
jgi:hypothetical protein